MHFDVFNGDADGIIALLQLYFSQGITAQSLTGSKGDIPKRQLVTGVKRDISLLEQVDIEQAKSVTVLDISMEKNIEALTCLLDRGVDVFYVDHHRTGEIPTSKHLTTLIDTDANTCTSLLVNKQVKGTYVNWAIAAAFGDNMFPSALLLAKEVGLTVLQQEQLKKLGTYINYNGYGQHITDLHFHPAVLFEKLLDYPDPFTLIKAPNSLFHQLEAAYLSDMKNASTAKVIERNKVFDAYLLPNEPWAKRVSGVFGNDLANAQPAKAHVVLTVNNPRVSTVNSSDNAEETYTLSLRAPLNNKQFAGELCANFDTGGGRASAAGINNLPLSSLNDFFELMHKYYSSSDCSSAHNTALL